MEHTRFPKTWARIVINQFLEGSVANTKGNSLQCINHIKTEEFKPPHIDALVLKIDQSTVKRSYEN